MTPPSSRIQPYSRSVWASVRRRSSAAERGVVEAQAGPLRGRDAGGRVRHVTHDGSRRADRIQDGRVIRAIIGTPGAVRRSLPLTGPAPHVCSIIDDMSGAGRASAKGARWAIWTRSPRGQGRPRAGRRRGDRLRDRGALAGAGAKVAVVDVTQERADEAAARIAEGGAEILRARPPTSPRRPTATGSWPQRSSASAASTSSSTASAAARARCCSTPRSTRATRGTGSWSSTCAARCSPTQAAVRKMIEAGQRRRGRQHQLGPRRARHQRRLLGLRRRQGRDQLADPPVGDRVGEARHPRQRHPADLRGHAPGCDAARRSRASRPASSAGSRSDASATRTT